MPLVAAIKLVLQGILFQAIAERCSDDGHFPEISLCTIVANHNAGRPLAMLFKIVCLIVLLFPTNTLVLPRGPIGLQGAKPCSSRPRSGRFDNMVGIHHTALSWPWLISRTVPKEPVLQLWCVK